MPPDVWPPERTRRQRRHWKRPSLAVHMRCSCHSWVAWWYGCARYGSFIPGQCELWWRNRPILEPIICAWVGGRGCCYRQSLESYFIPALIGRQKKHCANSSTLSSKLIRLLSIRIRRRRVDHEEGCRFIGKTHPYHLGCWGVYGQQLTREAIQNSMKWFKTAREMNQIDGWGEIQIGVEKLKTTWEKIHNNCNISTGLNEERIISDGAHLPWWHWTLMQKKKAERVMRTNLFSLLSRMNYKY